MKKSLFCAFLIATAIGSLPVAAYDDADRSRNLRGDYELSHFIANGYRTQYHAPRRATLQAPAKVAYVPTAFYRTKTKFYAFAYRPVFLRDQNRTNHLLAKSLLSQHRPYGNPSKYRLSEPGVSNDEHSYQRVVVPISSVKSTVAPDSPATEPQ